MRRKFNPSSQRGGRRAAIDTAGRRRARRWTLRLNADGRFGVRKFFVAAVVAVRFDQAAGFGQVVRQRLPRIVKKGSAVFHRNGSDSWLI